MNANNHGHDYDQNPITESLRRAASELTLRRGSHVAVVRAATRRQHRRHRAVAAGAVIAVGGGSVLTIQELTRTTTPTLRSPADDGSSVVDSVVDPTVETSPPTVPSPPNVASAARAAVRVESDLVWNVVTPDAASSVAFVGRFVLPGLVLSTAPGSKDNPGPSVVWRSDDGITWEQLDVELPVGSLFGGASFEGNRIYSVGTAPGIAATDPNPLIVAASSDSGSTWTTIPLPIDSNADADLPQVRTAFASAQTAPINGGVLVAVHFVVDLDFERLGLGNSYGWSTAGVVTQADPDCQPEDTRLLGIGVATTIPSPATPGAGTIAPSAYGGCELITRPWSDYGVPPETVAAMFERPSRLFRIADDGSLTEIASPAGSARLTLGREGVGDTAGPNPIVLATDQTGLPIGWYRYQDDGTWQELGIPAGAYFDIWPAGDGLVGTMSNGYTTQVAMSRDGTDWTVTDLAGLYDELSNVNTWQSTTSMSGALTMAVASTIDPIAAQGGAEITIDGVTARVERVFGQVAIIDAATGEPIDPGLITDTNEGVRVVDADGDVRALFPIETVQEKLLSDPGGATTTHWDVVRTLDGVSFSRESIAELLGLTDEDISSVAHISNNESKVVVAVTLTERDANDVAKQLVLVGTPRG